MTKYTCELTVEGGVVFYYDFNSQDEAKDFGAEMLRTGALRTSVYPTEPCTCSSEGPCSARCAEEEARQYCAITGADLSVPLTRSLGKNECGACGSHCFNGICHACHREQ